MSLKVYFDLMSQPARAVLLFLKANKIQYSPVLVDIRKGAHLTEEYRQVNPFQKVPAIDDNGYKLSESVAILKYLAVKYKTPDNWYPVDVETRGKIDEYLNWQHLNTRLNAAMLFRTQLIDPRVTGRPVDKEKVKHYRTELQKTLESLEKYFLNDRPYLCSQNISIADLMGICELIQPTACGENIAQHWPKVQSWMERVQNDLQPHFNEVHRILFAVRDRYLQAGPGGKL